MCEKSEQPSGVCAKFRLHLRGRRLVDVRQLGAERIVVFTFGARPTA
jgi:predicted ribosome quality control (RQC) complex YloA/Tae2 family protein